MEPVEAAATEPAAAPQTVRADHDGDISMWCRQVMICESWQSGTTGDGRDWRKIAAANPKVLTGGPDRLQVGWRLKIPDLDEGSRHEAGGRIVTVRRGDTPLLHCGA